MPYKVQTALKTGEYEGKYGKLIKYAVQVENELEPFELSQKPDTPAPKAGDTLEGTIEQTQYGRRFKKAQAQGGFSGGRSNFDSEGAAWGGSLKAAVDTVAISSDSAKKKPAENMLEVLRVAKYYFDNRKGVQAPNATQTAPNEATGGDPDIANAPEPDLPPVEAYDEPY